MSNSVKTTEVKLYPFRHCWTIENARWLVEGEELNGQTWIETVIKLENGEPILLRIWPKGREKGLEELVAIDVGGFLMRLYGKVKMGEDDSTEREVEYEYGYYQMDKYIRRSTLLKSASLLTDGALTIGIEGVAWNKHKKFNPKENLDSIKALLARTSVSSSRFPFRPPSPQNYFVTEWKIKAEKLPDVVHHVELDEQTIVGVRLAKAKLISLKDSLTLHLHLLQCSTDLQFTVRVAMWWQVKVLDDRGEVVASGGGYCIVRVYSANRMTNRCWVDGALIRRRGEEKVFAEPLFIKLPNVLYLRLEIIRIEETTLGDDVTSAINLGNYRRIFNHLQPAYLKQIDHSNQPSSAIFPLPLDLHSLPTKLDQLFAFIQQYIDRPNTTHYSINLPPVLCPFPLQPSTKHLLPEMSSFLNETAHIVNNGKYSVSILDDLLFQDDHVQYTIRVRNQQWTLDLYQKMLLKKAADTGDQQPEIVTESPVNSPVATTVSEPTFPTSLPEYTELLLTKVEEMMAEAKKSGDTNIVHRYNFKGAHMRNALLAFNSNLQLRDLTMNEVTPPDEMLSTLRTLLTEATTQLQTSLNTKSEHLEVKSIDPNTTKPCYTATVLEDSLKLEKNLLQFTVRVIDPKGRILDIEQMIPVSDEDNDLEIDVTTTTKNSLKPHSIPIIAWIFSPAYFIYPIPNPIRLWHYK